MKRTTQSRFAYGSTDAAREHPDGDSVLGMELEDEAEQTKVPSTEELESGEDMFCSRLEEAMTALPEGYLCVHKVQPCLADCPP